MAQSPALAVDVSPAPIYQIFEARWDTINERMPDIFSAGYGRFWLPPPNIADSGGLSVGYDVFDRFDYGSPDNQTLYGTENGLKSLVSSAHTAGLLVNTDLILNHNGFRDHTTPGFIGQGDYPGFVTFLSPEDDPNGVGQPFGDFHEPSFDESQTETFRLAGLIDIVQSRNNNFIRHPVGPDPQNIPSGSIWDQPDPNNARFYPDQALGTPVNDPVLGNTVLYDFNQADPLAGDPVVENAMALTMRSVRYAVQEIGIDGFRLDAARHFPRWVLDYFDQAVFLSKKQTLLDGSTHHPYSFIETGGDSNAFLQSFIRKDITSDTTVGGNRDALDFNLFFTMRDNLTGNGAQNNWHPIRNDSIDRNDDGLQNGSQGVKFVQSHDDIGPFLENVAYAYTLLLPGEAIVYQNAKQFGDGRDFPRDGKVDALGGFFGETITTLIDIRNSHGRGDFRERWLDDAFNPNGFSNVYVYERSDSMVVGLNSRNDTVVETRTGVQTDFAPGTILVELTGNAADAAVDPGGVIPESVQVNGSGQIDISIPANQGHGRGYVVYGLATPDSTLTLTNVDGVLAGETPTAENNGTARQTDIKIIRSSTFDVQLTTAPVSVPDPNNPGQFVRDADADGDQAILKIDGGVDLNNNSVVDNVTPGSVSYGFEEFVTTRTPGYIDDGNGNNIGTGTGNYVQTIDATQLSEGRHYLTTRVFRHRDSGPAVYEDQKETIYIDLLPPESAVVSFEPLAFLPERTENRDLIVESVDQTADSMHFFLNLPENVSDSEILQMALNNEGAADFHDQNVWKSDFRMLGTGNHVATIVTFEPTFDGTNGFNIQRVPGLLIDSRRSAGFGDLNVDNSITPSDLVGIGNDSFEDVLFSQGDKFNASADIDGDGDVDNLDLYGLGDELVAAGAPQTALDAYVDVRIRRGDLNTDGLTNAADVEHLYASFGNTDWLEDLNADGNVDLDDVQSLVEDVVGSMMGDLDLDGDIDTSDLVALQRGFGLASPRYDQGDVNLDGLVDPTDATLLQNAFGFGSTALTAVAAVPEPGTMLLATLLLGFVRPRRRATGGWTILCF